MKPLIFKPGLFPDAPNATPPYLRLNDLAEARLRGLTAAFFYRTARLFPSSTPSHSSSASRPVAGLSKPLFQAPLSGRYPAARGRRFESEISCDIVSRPATQAMRGKRVRFNRLMICAATHASKPNPLSRSLPLPLTDSRECCFSPFDFTTLWTPDITLFRLIARQEQLAP